MFWTGLHKQIKVKPIYRCECCVAKFLWRQMSWCCQFKWPWTVVAIGTILFNHHTVKNHLCGIPLVAESSDSVVNRFEEKIWDYEINFGDSGLGTKVCWSVIREEFGKLKCAIIWKWGYIGHMTWQFVMLSANQTADNLKRIRQLMVSNAKCLAVS